MHEPNDEQFENYLKDFRPIDPEPLPLRTKNEFCRRAASARLWPYPL